ncbi:MAG: GNAT family N-acetyltransferase [Planctomycetota bacterium]
MTLHIHESLPGDPLWQRIAKLFARSVRYMNDPKDKGDYHFLAATDARGRFLGGSVIDIGPLRFGPLADTTAGFLENIEVLRPYRRHGVATALLRATLRFAWRRGCESVRWTVKYDNTAAIALYRNAGCVFIPEEDPQARRPQRYYTVVAAGK